MPCRLGADCKVYELVQAESLGYQVLGDLLLSCHLVEMVLCICDSV